MPRRLLTAARRPSAMPLRVLLAVLLLVFAAEFGIMLLLPLPSLGRDINWRLSLVDSVTLTALLAPALWFLVVRPLQRLSESRGRLLNQLLRAQEEERARIALDLHDELGQQLTAALLGLRAVRDAGTLEQARERVDAVTDAAAGALESIRVISRGLRPPTLTDLGLRPALERLADEFQAVHDMSVTVEPGLSPGDRYAPDIETSVYRLVQEALTNAARHSGARHARVCVAQAAGGLEVTVSDDGRGLGPGPVRPGVGLAGMRERVNAHGGDLAVVSPPTGGVTVSALLPVEPLTREAKP